MQSIVDLFSLKSKSWIRGNLFFVIAERLYTDSSSEDHILSVCYLFIVIKIIPLWAQVLDQRIDRPSDRHRHPQSSPASVAKNTCVCDESTDSIITSLIRLLCNSVFFVWLVVFLSFFLLLILCHLRVLF